MRVAGILPAEAPDPRAEWAERLKLMPIPVIGLAPQPSLEDTDSVGLSYGPTFTCRRVLTVIGSNGRVEEELQTAFDGPERPTGITFP